MTTKILSDGHIMHENTIFSKQPDHQSKYTNFGLHKAMITSIIHKDDPKNRWKKGVEYSAVIIGGKRNGEKIDNLLPLCGLGGNDNFHEMVYKPKDKVLHGESKGDKTPPENTDGTHVIVGFLNGDNNFPIILSGWPQPNNASYGANKEDDLRILGAYQGLQWNIDKDGTMTITNKDTSIKLDNEGQVTITTGAKTVVNASDNVEITTSGDTNITTSGETNIVSSGNTNIDGAEINLGDGASHPLVFGDQLLALYNGHTHAGSPPPDQQYNSSHQSSKVKTA